MKRREFIKSFAIASSGLLYNSEAVLSESVSSHSSLPGAKTATRAIPSLDELAGQWIAGNIVDSLPALSNFHGGLETSHNVLGVQNFTIAPLAQGFQSATLSLDGVDVTAESFRWYPYQVLRKSRLHSVEILTKVRMPFEGPGILFSIYVSNRGTSLWAGKLAIGFHSAVREYHETWVWKTPRPEPNDAADFSSNGISSKDESIFLSHDRDSNGKSGIAFLRECDEVSDENHQAIWNLELKPDESFHLDAVMAAGSDLTSVIGQVNEWKENFSVTWEQAKERWQRRFEAAFVPGNDHFSGHLPTLLTSDAKIRRLYYTSILSLICLERTGLNSQFPRVFVTGSPRYATTVLYFWDTSFFATLWSLLDPDAMRQQLKLFLESDIHSCYAIDFQSLHPIGRWYSANDYSVFRLVTTYVYVTRDLSILEETLHGGQKVIDLLEDLTLHWKTLTNANSLLANYGSARNLLETVPTYVQRVPSMNAANVWMMRSMAKLRISRGESDKAVQLNKQADRLAAEVLGLYVGDKGYWACLLEDGRKTEVRHCIDFFTLIDTMQSDLGQMRIDEMCDFVDRELWTPHWLRALSLHDAAADESLRPDHGSTGSYDAWPALTAEAMFRVGHRREALTRLRSLAPATFEGPFGQSHDVESAQNPVRKAGAFGQEYYCSASGSFAEVLLRSIFGFSPDASEEWHGPVAIVPEFSGQLIHLRYAGKLLTITAKSR
jgi:hypothetical protein